MWINVTLKLMTMGGHQGSHQRQVATFKLLHVDSKYLNCQLNIHVLCCPTLLSLSLLVYVCVCIWTILIQLHENISLLCPCFSLSLDQGNQTIHSPNDEGRSIQANQNFGSSCFRQTGCPRRPINPIIVIWLIVLYLSYTCIWMEKKIVQNNKNWVFDVL